MILVGTSLSKCMASIARNEVKIGDILFIISNTRAENYEVFCGVIGAYLAYIPASEHDRVRKIISFLYKSGRIHQHRLFNDPQTGPQTGMEINQAEIEALGDDKISISPLEQRDLTTWIQLVPTNENTTPAVVAAYERYKFLDSLTK